MKFLNNIDVTNNKVTNLSDGTAPTDAMTLQQGQALVRGLSWKAACRAASTTNVTLASPGASIDGVTPVTGDRVLLKNQTAGAENGIYVWTGAAALLTRAADADTPVELDGAATLVLEGTVNADRMYTQTASPVVVGTTALTFVQLGGSASAYLAGNGLALTGQTFAVALDASSGLIVAGTGLKIDAAVVARKFAANFGNGSATSFTIAHGLGTADITTTVRTVATGEIVTPDITIDATNVTITMSIAPAANAYRLVVVG